MPKRALRQRMRDIKRQFTRQQLEELSLPVVERLKLRLAGADTVYAYYSLPDEVDTRQLLDDLLREGKTVLLPKVVDGETMTWHPYEGRQSLRQGAFGIMEPATEACGVVGEPQRSCILVPGVAFDGAGRRMGRGRGYYDRFLSVHPDIYKIGVCFGFQKVEAVPVDAHDVPVDEVI